MLIITKRWLVNEYNLFSSWEQSEKGKKKVRDGKSSLLAEGLNIKMTQGATRRNSPLIYSFKEHSRNIYVLMKGDTKRSRGESSSQQVNENIDV